MLRDLLDLIREITEQAERISSANISERLPVVQTGDEVERLSLSLIRMIERPDEANQHISRFVVDTSHELRTPSPCCPGIPYGVPWKAGFSGA